MPKDNSETESTTLVGGEDDALLTTEQVAARYSIHPRTVPLLEKEGRLPKRCARWTGNTPRWLKSVIVAHLRSLNAREVA